MRRLSDLLDLGMMASTFVPYDMKAALLGKKVIYAFIDDDICSNINSEALSLMTSTISNNPVQSIRSVAAQKTAKKNCREDMPKRIWSQRATS